VVVIGSYREDLPGLLAFSQRLLQLGLQVLHPSPRARRVGESSGFVRLDCDRSEDEGQVQRAVFSLIDQADTIILYNPSGRVGISAALEVGYGLRAHKLILATAAPEDVTIRALIEYDPAALPDFLRRRCTESRDEHAQTANG
jgi:hypothetical protein